MISIIGFFTYLLLVLSLISNGFLAYFLIKRPQKKELTLDAREILQDLSRGPAVIKVERIDPHDILLRSPRHQA